MQCKWMYSGKETGCIANSVTLTIQVHYSLLFQNHGPYVLDSALHKQQRVIWNAAVECRC